MTARAKIAQIVADTMLSVREVSDTPSTVNLWMAGAGVAADPSGEPRTERARVHGP